MPVKFLQTIVRFLFFPSYVFNYYCTKWFQNKVGYFLSNPVASSQYLNFIKIWRTNTQLSAFIICFYWYLLEGKRRKLFISKLILKKIQLHTQTELPSQSQDTIARLCSLRDWKAFCFLSLNQTFQQKQISYKRTHYLQI